MPVTRMKAFDKDRLRLVNRLKQQPLLLLGSMIVLAIVSTASQLYHLDTDDATRLLNSSQADMPRQQQATSKQLPPMTDSTSATVLGFATGYSIDVYRQFVGSLRNSGFKGHILLAVAPNIDPQSEEYLASKGVSIRKIRKVNCTIEMMSESETGNSHQAEVKTCVHPFHYLKARWGRFPFLREFLADCQTCTGPVLITDVRDTFFQKDPFGSGYPAVTGLQVFQEHRSMRTNTVWLTEWPLRVCKNITNLDKPMLCSGTTIGTRNAMILYLDSMHQEMKEWMADPKCHFAINGDDQTIHNYLFYTGKLPFAQAIPNRMGLVHTAGKQGAMRWKSHRKSVGNKSPRDFPYEGTSSKDKQWLPPEYDLTDEQGFLVNFDGSRSPVVHQFDRFASPIQNWLKVHANIVDT